MNNNWIIALIVFLGAAVIVLLIIRNKTDEKNLLNKFTKTEEEGKIDSNI